jgi:hypothetical protein
VFDLLSAAAAAATVRVKMSVTSPYIKGRIIRIGMSDAM